MSFWNDMYNGVSSGIHDVDMFLGGPLDGLLHPTDEAGHFARGLVDTLTMGSISAWDKTQYTKDYLKNTGQDWSDIKYPSMTGAGAMGRFAGNAFNFVSDNIRRLYK